MSVKGGEANTKIRGLVGSKGSRGAREDGSTLGERNGLTHRNLERAAVVERDLDHRTDHENEQGQVEQPACPQGRSVPPKDLAVSAKPLIPQETLERETLSRPDFEAWSRHFAAPECNDFSRTKPRAAQGGQEEQENDDQE